MKRCVLLSLLLLSFVTETSTANTYPSMPKTNKTYVKKAGSNGAQNIATRLQNLKAKYDKNSQPRKIKSRMFNLSDFDSITVKGPISVEIIGSTPLHDVRVVGTNNFVDNVHVNTSGRHLTVTLYAAPGEKGRALAIIRTDKLHKLRLYGRGTAKAIGLNSSALAIQTEYQGLIDLSGKRIGLHTLDVRGPGMIRFKGLSTSALKVKADGYNMIHFGRVDRLARFDFSGNATYDINPVNSHYLHVTGHGEATAIIHGLVDVLELTLQQSSIFDGRDLEVHTAFAKTFNIAQAHLHVLNSQHGYASDSSDILFYNDSLFIASHMVDSGAILNYGRVETQKEH